VSKFRIEKVRVKDLHRYAFDFLKRATPDEVVPISLQRALAHSQNPCASEDDIGLLVAILDEKSIGFQGILPGLLRVNGEERKIYWISSLYIAPEYRRLGVYTEILKSQLSLDYDFFYVGLSSEIVVVLRGLRVRELPSFCFCHLNLDRLADVLNIPARGARKLLGAESSLIHKWMASTRNRVSCLRPKTYDLLLNRSKSLFNDFSHREVEQISEEWMEGDVPSSRFERNAAMINWMLKSSWLSENDGRYCFGQTPGDWGKHIAIQVVRKGDDAHCGFFVLYLASRKGDVGIKILDCYFRDENDKRVVFPIALEYGKKVNAKEINFSKTLHEVSDLDFLTKRFVQDAYGTCFCILKKESFLATRLEEIRLDLGDGDTAFV
jgi:hypothetical protein